MKVYAIRDGEGDFPVGVLLYFEKEKSFVVELREELDEWTAPLLFSACVRRKIYTIPRDISFLWVKERIIPSGRQNIKTILKNHGLKEYDELKFLELSEGRCSQDSLYIRKIQTLPDYVIERRKHNVTECTPCGEGELLCFFADGKIKKTDLSLLRDHDDIDKILRNKALFESAKVAAGGYCVTFNDSIDIPASVLYSQGLEIPLRQSDFISFVRKNVLDTAQASQLLGCSRQNLAYMVSKERLCTLREDVKGNLYLKGEVLKDKW